MGQYGYKNDHCAGCDKRWIRLRDSNSKCCRCSNEGRRQHLEDNKMGQEEEEEEDESEVQAEAHEDDEQRRHVKGSQRWRNVKAVMAYYYALRKIKRNVAFVFGAIQSISGVFLSIVL